jgi:hypothetical protein
MRIFLGDGFYHGGKNCRNEKDSLGLGALVEAAALLTASSEMWAAWEKWRLAAALQI